MKLVDRIIFIIVGLFLLAIATGCVLLSFDVMTIGDITEFISGIKIDLLTSAVMVLVAVVLIVVSVRFFSVTPKKETVFAYTIEKNDEGEIAVAISAIENTVKLAIMSFSQIKDEKVSIRVENDGVSISSKISVPTGVMMPQLLSDVKQYIREFTQEHTGVKIVNLKIVAVEYKDIDTSNERKKLAAAQKQAQRQEIAKNARNADLYASTHSRVIITNAQLQEDNSEGKTESAEALESADIENERNVSAE